MYKRQQLTGVNTTGVTTITAGDNILVTQTGQVAIVTAVFSGGATGFLREQTVLVLVQLLRLVSVQPYHHRCLQLRVTLMLMVIL